MIARLHRDESGFTLVELMVVMVVAGVVMAIAGNSIISSISFQREQAAQVHQLNLTKVAFERLARDLRGADPLLEAEPDSVRVRVLRPGETEVLDTVIWRVEGGWLVRDTGSAAPVLEVDLADDVDLFTWFDRNDEVLPLDAGEPIPNVEVRRVEINLRVPYGTRGHAIELTENVMLRNAED